MGVLQPQTSATTAGPDARGSGVAKGNLKRTLG